MTHSKPALDTLSDLLIEKFGVDPNLIRPEAAIAELGLDSLSLMEFIFAAEDAFNLRIPEEKLNPTEAGLTLGAVSAIIDEMRANSST